ncbi:CHAP domain-containing protein [Limnoraphis robusta]|uniref:CHAP domain-containing protein n=1 Tax=Limnospira sp. TaxID=3100384 RepID=UPI003F6E93A2|nr:CHAP domain-containing protein [Limnoraphis robusta]
MFSVDTDTKEISGLLGTNPNAIARSDGDILESFNAHGLPVTGAVEPVLLPTLVPVEGDRLVMDLDISVDQEINPAETDSHTAPSVDSLTGMALANTYEQLQQFANSPEFLSQMSIAFGDDFDVEAAQDLADSLTNGTFEMPPTTVVSVADINGSNGAFAAATNNIYLASEFVAENADNPEAIVSVLLEEIGHYIDSQINISDTPGDEGAIFSGLVQGREFDAGELEALMAVDDTATVMINGEATLIEQSSSRTPLLTQQNANYFRNRPQFYTTGNIFAQSMFGSSLVGGRGHTEGNCTWYAHGRVKELGGSVAALNSMRGNANQWHTQLSNGARIVSDPQPGDIAQWTRNGQNHVAVVERVYQQNGVRRVTLSESHYRNNFDGGGAGTLHRIVDYTANNPDRYIRVPGVLASTPSPLPTQPSTSAFRGTVDGALNIRSGPGTNNSIVGSLSPGHSRTFDAVARGTMHWDAREQRNDNRWFRIQNTNQWVSASFITGNPLFTGAADTTLNIRSGPGTNFSVVGSLSNGSRRTFDATTVGTTHWDTRERKNENRWFRLQNTNQWVSAAFITGDPTY